MSLLEPIQASPAYAEDGFRFLTDLGFEVNERWVSGGQSFRDGWRLSYSSAAVAVVIVYLDSQFEVVFTRLGVSVDYWSVDRDLFARRSGFHGNMFPSQKLASAIDRVSADIQTHYGPLLAGDEATWRVLAAGSGVAQAKGRLP